MTDEVRDGMKQSDLMLQRAWGGLRQADPRLGPDVKLLTGSYADRQLKIDAAYRHPGYNDDVRIAFRFTREHESRPDEITVCRSEYDIMLAERERKHSIPPHWFMHALIDDEDRLVRVSLFPWRRVLDAIPVAPRWNTSTRGNDREFTAISIRRMVSSACDGAVVYYDREQLGLGGEGLTRIRRLGFGPFGLARLALDPSWPLEYPVAARGNEDRVGFAALTGDGWVHRDVYVSMMRRGASEMPRRTCPVCRVRHPASLFLRCVEYSGNSDLESIDIVFSDVVGMPCRLCVPAAHAMLAMFAKDGKWPPASFWLSDVDGDREVAWETGRTEPPEYRSLRRLNKGYYDSAVVEKKQRVGAGQRALDW